MTTTPQVIAVSYTSCIVCVDLLRLSLVSLVDDQKMQIPNTKGSCCFREVSG